MFVEIEKYHQFAELTEISRKDVQASAIDAVKLFHEKEGMEPIIRDVLIDSEETPHGPTELADILTVQLSRRETSGLGAVVIKGRSFTTITPKDISHQVFRLRKISDLRFALLVFVGSLHDQANDEFIQTCVEIGADYTLVDAVDFARIAIIAGFLCPSDGTYLQNGSCNCGYLASGERLNLLQKEALRALDEAHSSGKEAGVAVMPTGSGKTRIAAIDATSTSAGRILYVAHTHEILDVAEKEFSHQVGRSAIARNWPIEEELERARVHLSTIQSITKRPHQIHLTHYDYVIIDEFHHAAARTYHKLVNTLSPKFILGLTATPYRADQQDVVDLCQGNVVVRFELRAGIDSGVLSPFHYYGCFDNVDYSALKWGSNGYSISDLNKTLIIPERDQAIIEKWIELANGLPTIAFCCSRQHAQRVAESFRSQGVPAEPYLGNTSFDKRQDLVRDLQVGDVEVLCAVDVLNEGVDIPFVRCLPFLRPTESERIFFQQLGRGLRRSRGKTHAIVLDFIGNFRNSFRITEYLGLDPSKDPLFTGLMAERSSKAILNLPQGCKVRFDDWVIDIFAQQILDPRRATRHNIGQILVWQYRRTAQRLGRKPRRVDIDRMQLLHSDFYKDVFGSWAKFEKVVADLDISEFML